MVGDDLENDVNGAMASGFQAAWVCRSAAPETGVRDDVVTLTSLSELLNLVPAPDPGDWAVRPFFDGQFLRLIPHVPAGLALQALLDLTCIGLGYRHISRGHLVEELVGKPPGVTHEKEVSAQVQS